MLDGAGTATLFRARNLFIMASIDHATYAAAKVNNFRAHSWCSSLGVSPGASVALQPTFVQQSQHTPMAFAVLAAARWMCQ